MAIYQIHSIPIEITVARRAVDLVSEAQITQLVQSLNRLPDEHLRRLPTITIKYFAEYAGGGSRLDRDEPENSFIRISHRCFQSSWNQPLTEPNQTLLHEVGHIIDWTYGCMGYLRHNHREEYRALQAHPHSGRTQGAGEHYADAYKDYFVGSLLRGLRYDALMHSPAFRSIAPRTFDQLLEPAQPQEFILQ